MHGVTFRNVSLRAEEYRRVLQENGCNLAKEFFDDAENYYYVAEKIG